MTSLEVTPATSLVITHSDIKNFLRCKRLWHWTYVLDFKLPEIPAGNLAVGTRVHAAIEALYKGEDPWKAHEKLVSDALAWADDTSPPSWVMDELYENIIIERNCILSYERWLDDEKPDALYKVEAVEETIEAPLLDGRVTLRGKADLLFRRMDSGFLVVDDLKTNGRQTVPREEYERSWQHWVYIAILRLARPGEIVSGAEYTVINKIKDLSKPTTRKPVERFSVPGTTKMASAKMSQLETICDEMLRSMTLIEGEGIRHAYPTPDWSCKWCDFRQPCELLDESPLAARAMLDDRFTRGARHDRYGKR